MQQTCYSIVVVSLNDQFITWYYAAAVSGFGLSFLCKSFYIKVDCEVKQQEGLALCSQTDVIKLTFN